jgi:hypothetical protein
MMKYQFDNQWSWLEVWNISAIKTEYHRYGTPNGFQTFGYSLNVDYADSEKCGFPYGSERIYF